MSTCSICVENFNKTVHKPIQCIRCDEKICESCIQRYLLDSPHTPHCMNCRTEWDRLFYGRHLSTTFLNKSLKKHREKMLLEHERAQFPNTMPLLEQLRQIKEITANQNVILKEIRKLNVQLNSLENQKKRIQNEYDRMRTTLIRHDNVLTVLIDQQEDQESRVNYRRPCVTADCPGFIHSTRGLCNSCHKITCLKCNVTEQENHECQQSDIDMWTHLRQTTKPCPGCHTRIYKNGGCPQMWCSQCHTAFNWNTGQIEIGPVHNPHYYQWLFRENRGEQDGPRRERMQHLFGDNDVNCGPQMHVSALALRNRIDSFRSDTDSSYKTWIKTQHQMFVHFQHTVLPSVHERQSQRTFETQKVDLRISYLSGNISENEFRVQLQRLEKRFMKHQELYRIYQTFSTIIEQAFRQFVSQRNMTISDLYQQFVDVCSISNEGIENINKCYKSKISNIQLVPLR